MKHSHTYSTMIQFDITKYHLEASSDGFNGSQHSIKFSDSVKILKYILQKDRVVAMPLTSKAP